MQQTPKAQPPSARTSIYSLRTLSRPTSAQRPSSILEHPPVPPKRQSLEDSQESDNRDEFLIQDVDRYDRIWGDMAARMGELDSLATNPAKDMRLVSEPHAKSVEQLREAQVRLAEAWAGSESRLESSQSSLLAKLANSAAGVEEAEISDEDRSKMNDQIFQQMENEVGIVMVQLEEVITAQREVEKASRDMWKTTTLTIDHNVEKESDQK